MPQSSESNTTQFPKYLLNSIIHPPFCSLKNPPTTTNLSIGLIEPFVFKYTQLFDEEETTNDLEDLMICEFDTEVNYFAQLKETLITSSELQKRP